MKDKKLFIKPIEISSPTNRPSHNPNTTAVNQNTSPKLSPRDLRVLRQPNSLEAKKLLAALGIKIAK